MPNQIPPIFDTFIFNHLKCRGTNWEWQPTEHTSKPEHRWSRKEHSNISEPLCVWQVGKYIFQTFNIFIAYFRRLKASVLVTGVSWREVSYKTARITMRPSMIYFNLMVQAHKLVLDLIFFNFYIRGLFLLFRYILNEDKIKFAEWVTRISLEQKKDLLK